MDKCKDKRKDRRTDPILQDPSGQGQESKKAKYQKAEQSRAL